MSIKEAAGFIGKNCLVSWFDNAEHMFSEVMRVEDVLCVPLYGEYLIGDEKEVRLDRITRLEAVLQ